MDEKLVERVARSVFIAMGHEPEEWAANPTAQAVAIKVARAAITAYLSARSAEPVAWEVFQDEGYFGMWCVREVGASRFGDGFHVVSQEEARALKSILCAHPKEAPDV